MNIKEGDYLRTSNGEILQIEKIFDTADDLVRFQGNPCIARVHIGKLKQILVSEKTLENSKNSESILDLLEERRFY